MSSLTKGLNRIAQSIKNSVGASEKHFDAEYNALESVVDQQEKVAQNLCKYLNQFNDITYQMIICLRGISEEYKKAYADNCLGELSLAKELIILSEQLEKEAVFELREKVTKNALEPLQSYVKAFPGVKNLQKKRKEKLLDYQFQRDRYKAASQKTNEQINTIRSAMEKEQIEFENADAQAKNAMLDLTERRYELIHPTVQSVSTNLLQYFGKLYQTGSNRAIQIQNSSIPPLQRKERYTRKIVTDITPHAIETEEPKQILTVPPNISTTAIISPTILPNNTHLFYPQQEELNIMQEQLPQQDTVPSHFVQNKWFYLDDSLKQNGPISFTQFKILYHNGTIKNTNHVFLEDVTPDWVSVADFPNLTCYL